MKCQNCGNKLPVGEIYCKLCEANINADNTQEQDIKAPINNVNYVKREVVVVKNNDTTKDIDVAVSNKILLGLIHFVFIMMIVLVCYINSNSISNLSQFKGEMSSINSSELNSLYNLMAENINNLITKYMIKFIAELIFVITLYICNIVHSKSIINLVKKKK